MKHRATIVRIGKAILFLCLQFLSACTTTLPVKVNSISAVEGPFLEQDFITGKFGWKDKASLLALRGYGETNYFKVNFSTTYKIEKNLKRLEFSTPVSEIYNCKKGDEGGLFLAEIYSENENRKKEDNIYYYSFLFPINFELVDLAFQVETFPRTLKYWNRESLDGDKLCFHIRSGNYLGLRIISKKTVIYDEFIQKTAIYTK